jgi:hypothetical protein
MLAETIIMVIRSMRDELAVRLAKYPELQRRYLEGDTSIAVDATISACDAVGVIVNDYRDTVDANPTLLWLETETLRESFVGSPDPGPYDVISGERASAVMEDEPH